MEILFKEQNEILLLSDKNIDLKLCYTEKKIIKSLIINLEWIGEKQKLGYWENLGKKEKDLSIETN